MKKSVKNPILKTWLALNEYIRTATEEQCKKLLKEELAGRARELFILRIHSRLNAVRARTERKKLLDRKYGKAKSS